MNAALVILDRISVLMHGEVDNQPTTVDATIMRAATVDLDTAIDVLRGSLGVLKAAINDGEVA